MEEEAATICVWQEQVARGLFESLNEDLFLLQRLKKEVDLCLCCIFPVFSYLHLSSIKYIVINKPLKCQATRVHKSDRKIARTPPPPHTLLSPVTSPSRSERCRDIHTWAWEPGSSDQRTELQSNSHVTLGKSFLSIPSKWWHSDLLELLRHSHEITYVKYWMCYNCPIDARALPHCSRLPDVYVTFPCPMLKYNHITVDPTKADKETHF